ncbi:MAG: hypothetical protein LUE93_02070 [Bacteroides sp.]|nr:hypothetical protein [Bacteroides sp.]
MVRSLLSDIELDIHELRFLLNAVTENPDLTLQNVAKRNILQMRERLDRLYEELDNLIPIEEPAEDPIQETEVEDISAPEEEIVCEWKEEIPVILPVEEKTTEESPEVVTETPEIFPVQEEKFQEPVPEITIPTTGTTPVHESLPAEVILGERFKRDISLRKSLSLNDTFLYSRELFGGDTAQLHELLEKLDELHSVEEALRFAGEAVDLTKEDEAALSFIELLKKHFN